MALWRTVRVWGGKLFTSDPRGLKRKEVGNERHRKSWAGIILGAEEVNSKTFRKKRCWRGPRPGWNKWAVAWSWTKGGQTTLHCQGTPGSYGEPQKSLQESSRNHEVATANLPMRHNMSLELSSPRQGQQWKGAALQYWIPRRYKCNLEAGGFCETLARTPTQADTGWFIGELLNFPKAFAAPFSRVITYKTWRHSRGRQSAETPWVISNLEIIFFLKQPGWSTAVVSRTLPLIVSRGCKEMFLKLCWWQGRETWVLSFLTFYFAMY